MNLTNEGHGADSTEHMNSERMKTSKTIEALGSHCVLAMEVPNSGEILVFSEELTPSQVLKVAARWADDVEPGETLKATGESVIVHTANPQKWVQLGGNYNPKLDKPGEGFKRHTVWLTEATEKTD